MNTSSTADDLFLRLMCEAGKVSDSQYREAEEQAAVAESDLSSPYRILLERGLIGPAETARVLAAKFGFATVEVGARARKNQVCDDLSSDHHHRRDGNCGGIDGLCCAEV